MTTTLRNFNVGFTVAELGEYLIAFIFAISAVVHLANPYQFLDIVYSMQLVGRTTGLLVAMVVPALQLVIGACLWCGIWRRCSLVVACLLFAVFFMVHLFVWIRIGSVDCGCFGGLIESTVGARSLVVLFVMCAIAGLLGRRALLERHK